MIFDLENSLCDEAAKLGKASWNAYNQGGWLIFKTLWKIGLLKMSLSRLMTLVYSVGFVITRETFFKYFLRSMSFPGSDITLEFVTTITP